MKNTTKIKFTVLCLVPFVMVLGNSMLIPVLPQIKTALDITQLHVGLLITVFSVPAGIVIPFAGFLSDQLGRRTIIIPALIVYGLGGLIAGISSLMFENPYYFILTGRIIQGIGAGGTYQLAMALTGDIFKSKERVKALGILEAANGLGKVISPLAGAAAGLVAWYFPFFVYGLLAIPIAVLFGFVIKKPKEKSKKQNFKNYKKALKTIFVKKAMPLFTCFLAGMFALFVLFGILSYYSDILEEVFNIKGFLKGLVIAGPVFIMSVISFSLGIFLQNKTSYFKIIVIIGLVLIIIGQTFFALIDSFWLLFSSTLFIGMGVGAILPPVNSLVTGSTSDERRGIVTCLYGSVRFFGVAAGPPLYGFTDAYGKSLPLMVSSGLTFLVLILVIFFMNENKILGKR